MDGAGEALAYFPRFSPVFLGDIAHGNFFGWDTFGGTATMAGGAGYGRLFGRFQVTERRGEQSRRCRVEEISTLID